MDDDRSLALQTDSVEAMPFAIPGAEGEFRIQILKVLAVQQWQSRDGHFDFEPA